MMRLQDLISGKEVLAEKLVRPGWYPTKIEEIDEKLAKDKESMNIIVDVTGGPDCDAAGVPQKNFFSEKFIQNINPFIRATSAQQGIPKEKVLDEKTGLHPDYDIKKTKGVYVYAQWATDRGKDGQDKPRNSIVDWAELPKELAHLNPTPAVAGAVGAAGFEA